MIVTGSEGFIGKALCRELAKRGVEVIGLDRKCGTEATEVCELLKNGGIDCVFHLAAQTSVFNGNLEQIRRDNIDTFMRVANACNQYHVKLVYASSSTANPENTTSLYGISKYFDEQYASIYCKAATGCRLHNVYGPNPRKRTLLWFLMEKENMNAQQIDDYLNRRSGILGISGLSSDFRDLESAANRGDDRSQLAIDVFAYKVKKYIGGYVAAMGGVDAIVFTAGLGENSPFMRDKICNGLEYLGTRIDPDLNQVRGKEREISVRRARVKIFVIPTNEELVIARDTYNICRRIIKL